MNTQERILIVDGDTRARARLELILRELPAGYPVEIAADGRKALATLAERPLALVIAALETPGAGGLELLAAVKTRLPTAEVILVTEQGTLDSAVAALRHGAHDYFVKPVDPAALVQSVERAMARRRQNLEHVHLGAEARRADELEALYEAGQAINRTLDLQETLTTTLAIARSLTRASVSNVYLFDPEQQCLDSVVTLGEMPALSDADRRRSAEIAWEVLERHRSGQPFEPTIIADPSTGGGQAGPGERAIQTWLAIPLATCEAPVGVLELGSTQVHAFTGDDVQLVQVIAAQAATAIENARLYEEIQQRLEQNLNLFRALSAAYMDLAGHREEILRSHRTLQALFDGITDGLYIVDQNLRIIAINQGEAKRLGKPQEALIGQACDTWLWGEAKDAVIQLVRNSFATGNEGDWESSLDAARRGPFTDRDVRTYPIFNAAGDVNQVIILAQDVSEKRQLQASLFRSANLAAVGQLASSIAHQINNPLTMIITNGQLLEMVTDPASPDYPGVKDIVDGGMRIRQIVQNLLDFSTQDSYGWFETDLEETVDEALTLVAHPLRKNNIKVVKKMTDLPLVMASASHLKLLWMNLLLNARDAITASGRHGTIEIRALQPDADHVQVQIVDDGIGIPSQHRDRLFQPFFTNKLTGQGLGLGLYTCRLIVERHHGQIGIETRTRPGGSRTIATITLPVETPPAPDSPADGASPEAGLVNWHSART